MQVSRGIRWDDGRQIRLAAALLLALAALAAYAMSSRATTDGPVGLVSVVVGETTSTDDAAERAVDRLGGDVRQHLGVIDGFVASVPADRVDDLDGAPGVRSVTEDRQMHLASLLGDVTQTVTEPVTTVTETATTAVDATVVSPEAAAEAETNAVPTLADTLENTADTVESVVEATEATATVDAATASLNEVNGAIGAKDLHAKGVTGKGVDVALIDSGVMPLGSLKDSVVNGADFSTESKNKDVKFLDAFGHGTHLAGIITGRNADTGYTGVAPDSRVVNVRAAAGDGSTSLVQLLSSMDWVVNNKAKNGLNIRVLNLSLGAEVLGSYRYDPLAYAVEKVWRSGIVVVAAGGNGGAGTTSLDAPAYDPFVVAVAATDTKGTAGTSDDVVADFSSRGNTYRAPDLAVPGTKIVSLRVPNSFLDLNFEGGRIGEAYFRGSGTSQSAAVASGAVALLLQQNPALVPDQVKALLKGGATSMTGDVKAEGRGRLDIAKAADLPVPSVDAARQTFTAATQQSVSTNRGVEIGQVTPSGTRWSGTRWSGTRWSGTRWSGTRWSGTRWSGTRWSTGLWGDLL